MKKVVFGILTLALFACNSETETDYKIEAKEAPAGSKITAGKAEQSANVPQKVEKLTTTIEFDKYKHDFGTVFKGSKNQYTFRFKNIGSVPCVIESAKASCGCTIPKKPEKPVPPGEYGELEVVFKPKDGQVGQLVTKTITVNANTVPNPIKLEIKGMVVEGMGK